MTTWESPDDRRARHADVVTSAVVAGLVTIALATLGDVRGLPLFVGTVLGGGVSMAVLTARRAGWAWRAAWPILLAYGGAGAILWGVARAMGYR
jgi:hypothetical protein